MSSFKIPEKQASRDEELTRDQGNSKLWYSFRAGRITASMLKAACHSDPRMPSKSLINTICYPEAVKLSTKATEYGLTHETEVLCKYKDNMEQGHSDFIIRKSGFVIHPEVPYLGASPDSIVSCSCCGHGSSEVKCPFSKTDMMIQDAIISDDGFCLEISDNGHPKLKTSHAFYYQVQFQIFCTNTEYCDFVVWTGKDLHWERILQDQDFLEVCMQRAHSFLLLAVLPELLARFYSSPATTAVSAQNGDTMCYCHSSRDTATKEVMTCSYKKCPYGIFNKKCLRFTSLNLTEHQQKLKNWYCPHCVQLGVSKGVNEE
ncbi:uncharacterized protein LOC119722624 [Patiria miniata]|uniref:YqaJ viral recombinase domain-containing protein n=1 Tax=Patiria miniata TaxID=46514 RepID=A0A913ZCI2_PATMI|nr:uncharacterized protein LOC119722624 [Patiria miniata]